MAAHKPGIILLYVLSWIFFITTLFFNFVGGFLSELIDLDIFLNNTGDLSDVFYVEITPAGWTFQIWSVIYLYQMLWGIYAMTLFCRKSENGHLYYSPPFMHWTIYLFFNFNLALNVGWLFAWDRALIVVALPILAGVAFTLYICLGISMRGIFKYYPDLVRCGHPNEPRYVIGFVHNGLGTYAAWTTVATLINLAVVLRYSAGLEQSVASAIALGALAFELVVYMMVDLVLLERYFRFLFTPYLVVIVALIGSLDKNWDPTNPNSMFTVALLAIVTLGFLVKVCAAIGRQRFNPIFSQKSAYA